MTSPYDFTVFALCAAAGLPEPEAEVRFDKVRKWRFDFAWKLQKVALEVEGGTWAGGRHTRGSGYLADCAKYNAAVLAGWRVLRYSPEQIRDGVWVEDVMRLVVVY